MFSAFYDNSRSEAAAITRGRCIRITEANLRIYTRVYLVSIALVSLFPEFPRFSAIPSEVATDPGNIFTDITRVAISAPEITRITRGSNDRVHREAILMDFAGNRFSASKNYPPRIEEAAYVRRKERYR